MKQKYYTIYFGDHPYDSIVDRNNLTAIWAFGNIFWSDIKKAKYYLKYLQSFNIGKAKLKLVVFTMSVTNNGLNKQCKCGAYTKSAKGICPKCVTKIK